MSSSHFLLLLLLLGSSRAQLFSTTSIGEDESAAKVYSFYPEVGDPIVIAQQVNPPLKTSLNSLYSSPLPQRRMDDEGAVTTPLEQRASPLMSFFSSNPYPQGPIPSPSSFQGMVTSPFKALFGSGSTQRHDTTPTQFIQEPMQQQEYIDSSNPKETIWTPFTSLFSSNLNQDQQASESAPPRQQDSDASESVDFDYNYGSGPTHHHDDHSSYTTSYTSPTKVSHSHSTFLDGALLGPSPIIHSSSSPWAPPPPLKVIKYFKDSVNSFRFTPYVGKDRLNFFSHVGNTLDATFGGAWAARRAIKKGAGTVLSSKVRLGGTLAYVGSEVLAKVIDAAASI